MNQRRMYTKDSMIALLAKLPLSDVYEFLKSRSADLVQVESATDLGEIAAAYLRRANEFLTSHSKDLTQIESTTVLANVAAHTYFSLPGENNRDAEFAARLATIIFEIFHSPLFCKAGTPLFDFVHKIAEKDIDNITGKVANMFVSGVLFRFFNTLCARQYAKNYDEYFATVNLFPREIAYRMRGGDLRLAHSFNSLTINLEYLSAEETLEWLQTSDGAVKFHAKAVTALNDTEFCAFILNVIKRLCPENLPNTELVFTLLGLFENRLKSVNNFEPAKLLLVGLNAIDRNSNRLRNDAKCTDLTGLFANALHGAIQTPDQVIEVSQYLQQERLMGFIKRNDDHWRPVADMGTKADANVTVQDNSIFAGKTPTVTNMSVPEHKSPRLGRNVDENE